MQRRHRRAEGEAHQLQPVDGHAHRLGRERILALRPPRAAGAREVDEAERDVDDDEERERDVEIRDGEDAAVLDGQVVAEEVERVDPQDPVRAAGDVVAVDAVAVRRQRLEQL